MNGASRTAWSRSPRISAPCIKGSCTKGSAPPAFIVHSLAHAVAVLTAAAETGRPVLLLSPPDAGISAGPGWFRAMIGAAHAAVRAAGFTAILDCGDDAGAAQAAIRAGIEAVIFIGRPDVATRLADIAKQRGMALCTVRPPAAVDLGTMFFADAETLRRQCCDVLASVTRFC